MTVNWLDHVNIVTEDVAATARFFADLLDLEVRDGPGGMRPDLVQWVYDREGRPIVHVNKVGSFTPLGRTPRVAADTNALHHVAFNCTGHERMVQRLETKGLPFASNAVPAIGLKQLFVTEPNGVLLELNFYEA